MRCRSSQQSQPGGHVVESLHFDTDVVPSGDREELVRDVLSDGMLLELENLRDASEGIDVRLEATGVGPLGLASMHSSPTAATRSPRRARDDSPPTLHVQVMQSGVSTLVQEGREAVYGSSELIMVLSSRANTVVSTRGTHRRMLQVPLEHLGVPDAVLRDALAVPISRDLPLAGVLGRLVEGLPLQPDLRPTEGEHLAQAALDLVRGLIATVVGEEPQIRRLPEAALQLHVADYLRQHWQEHDLTADRFAAAHHISTRQLYRLLAAEGISLGDWVRQRRLEACRDELARPRTAPVSVATVGRRWGFPDATNFGRAFKAAYGATPLQWHLLHQRR